MMEFTVESRSNCFGRSTNFLCASLSIAQHAAIRWCIRNLECADHLSNRHSLTIKDSDGNALSAIEFTSSRITYLDNWNISDKDKKALRKAHKKGRDNLDQLFAEGIAMLLITTKLASLSLH